MSGNEVKNDAPRKDERRLPIIRVIAECAESCIDSVAVEEPLEIRLVFGSEGNRRSKSLSITMRTPGHDFELAAGFLLSENIVTHSDQIDSFSYVGTLDEHGGQNRLEVILKPDVQFDVSLLQRNFYTTSSCGICGKASLEAVKAQGVVRLPDGFTIDQEKVFGAPGSIRSHQGLFDRTGGIHAAGLIDSQGCLVAIREDVGRHNAVDKLIGSQMMGGQHAMEDKVIVVSGRASFELLQKALLAKIPILIAVGAPSSLAVETANEFNLTLIGFTSKQRFNIYSGEQRIRRRVRP